MTRQSSRYNWACLFWKRWFYVLSWWWLNPILQLGYKQELTNEDLVDLSENDKCSVLLSRLTDCTTNEIKPTKIKTWHLMMRIFWKESLVAICLFFPYTAARIAQPLLLRAVVLNINQTHQTTESAKNNLGYLYAVMLFVCSAAQALIHQHIYFSTTRMGMRVRTLLSTIVYKHLLSLGTAQLQETTTAARTLNLIASDVSKFEDFCQHVQYLWEAPIQALIIFGIIAWAIGIIPTLFGYGVLLLIIPFQMASSRQFSRLHKTAMTFADKRVQTVSEIVYGSQIIKIYNWEKPMRQKVLDLRRSELYSIARANRIRAINMAIYFSSLPLISLAAFGGSWLLGNELKSEDIFTALALFALIRVPVTSYLPVAIERLSEMKVASKRIDMFMQLRTVSKRVTVEEGEKVIRIIMQNASFSWENIACLSNLNVQIEPGTLVGITGAVGSGKSSFLNAILGEMTLISGHINVHGSLSYVAQSPWIFPDTIRANILFGKPFDENKYNSVIKACCLDVDLVAFGSIGDLRILEDKGTNVSGGQCARIALARALYADVDIYLLDDPLAAVDQTVARQIYEQCIGRHGLLKEKTRLLVTHQTQFLYESAHQIIFLREGRIDPQAYVEENIPLKNPENNGTDQNKTATQNLLLDLVQSSTNKRSIDWNEVSATGGVSWLVWIRLFTSTPMRWYGLCLLILFMFIGEAIFDASNKWLSLWSSKSYFDQRTSSQFYIYLSLTLGTLIFALLRAQYYFYVMLQGSSSLHTDMLNGILQTSLRFFENNPSGRILNRVSKDQQVIDEQLPAILFDALQCLLMTLGSLIIIAIINPWVLFVLIPLLPSCWWLRRFYLKSSRQLKRLDSVTRSPVYAQFSSSLHGGLTTIRAFEAESYFMQLFMERLDANSRPFFLVIGAVRWFGMRLDLMTSLVSLVTGILVVALRNRIDPASAALSLMYCINLTMLFQWAARQLAEAENYMTSAERIHEYGQLPLEENDEIRQTLQQPPADWPSQGAIQFNKYSMRYRPDLPPVLNNIDIMIKPREKVGVIGRTGAGKSSLLTALLRFVDQNAINGSIVIDNIDISRVSLTCLRSRLCVIPQRPILFVGTLRYNLDPLDEYSDEECLAALESVQLKHLVVDNPDGLHLYVAECGANFSTGQCQLICIARAILKKSKILLIDEATANIDHATDSLIQTVIAENFHDRTILTVAHRLHTIAESNRILVLDQGAVADFDVPQNILPNSNNRTDLRTRL